MLHTPAQNFPPLFSVQHICLSHEHRHTYFTPFQTHSLSLCLSLSLPLSRTQAHILDPIPNTLSLCVTIHLSPSLLLSTPLSFSLSLSLSPSACLSVCLTIHLSLCLGLPGSFLSVAVSPSWIVP